MQQLPSWATTRGPVLPSTVLPKRLLTFIRCSPEDDSPKEECQEGYPVLPDGLRCLWNRYASLAHPFSKPRPDHCACVGAHHQRQASYRQLMPFDQAEPHSSTPSAARMSSSIRMLMRPPTPTLKTASRSVPLQSVRGSSQAQLRRRPFADRVDLELELDEEGTRISLTIVDTPGFGDQIDNEARYVLMPTAFLSPLVRLC